MPGFVDGCDCAGCNDARRQLGLSDGPKVEVEEFEIDEIDEDLEDEEDRVQCGNCEAWWDEDDLYSVSWLNYSAVSGMVTVTGLWCEDCTRTCYRCDNVVRNGDARNIWDEWYCVGCLTECANCGNTMPINDETSYCSEDCENHGCNCESPALEFTIRNDGQEPLANDVPVAVSLPAGIISVEGLRAIQQYLLGQAANLRIHNPDVPASQITSLREVGYRLWELDAQWQTKEGNYTKRLSRMAYQRYAYKVSPDIISQVGCIAREHSGGKDYDIEVTRDLNLSAEEFANEGSCWWGSEYEGRCALKSNGGFAIRDFRTSETSYGEVRTCEGRVWVLPLRVGDDIYDGKRLLLPTFETLTPAAFVVFNGYGTLGGYAGARILSHLAGMTYRKINFGCSPMYINSGSGYLVAPEEIAEPYTDGGLELDCDLHSTLFEDEQIEINEKENEYV